MLGAGCWVLGAVSLINSLAKEMEVVIRGREGETPQSASLEVRFRTSMFRFVVHRTYLIGQSSFWIVVYVFVMADFFVFYRVPVAIFFRTRTAVVLRQYYSTV